MKKYLLLAFILGITPESLISQDESALPKPETQSIAIESPVEVPSDSPASAEVPEAPDVQLQVESTTADDAELSKPPEQPEVVKVEKQIEYGGVLLKMLQPEKVSDRESATVEPARKKTNPFQLFNPFAPAEYGNGGTTQTEWTSRRRLPTRFRRIHDSEPVGVNLFFIRF